MSSRVSEDQHHHYAYVALFMQRDAEGLRLKDRNHNLQRYKATFRGKAAVAWLLRGRLVSDEREAIRVGNQLAMHSFIQYVSYNLIS